MDAYKTQSPTSRRLGGKRSLATTCIFKQTVMLSKTRLLPKRRSSSWRVIKSFALLSRQPHFLVLRRHVSWICVADKDAMPFDWLSSILTWNFTAMINQNI
jgi:hypothetical protein